MEHLEIPSPPNQAENISESRDFSAHSSDQGPFHNISISVQGDNAPQDDDAPRNVMRMNTLSVQQRAPLVNPNYQENRLSDLDNSQGTLSSETTNQGNRLSNLEDPLLEWKLTSGSDNTSLPEIEMSLLSLTRVGGDLATSITPKKVRVPKRGQSLEELEKSATPISKQLFELFKDQANVNNCEELVTKIHNFADTLNSSDLIVELEN